jgi:hypothetical protein
MKKYSVLFVFLAFSLAAISQKAVINFEKKVHDFGKVNEEDGRITYVFAFTNSGGSPLVINRVQASCGCTTPVWTKEPIEPGKKGSITVTYNTVGRPFVFNKSIVVYSNATEEQVTLIIKGDVIPKQIADNPAFPVSLGDIRAKSKIVQMNNVNKGMTQVRTFDIQNSAKTQLKLSVENLPAYLSASISPEVIKPNEEGKITFTFNSKNCTQWGPLADDVYLVLNGQKRFSDEYKITVISNVVEDFSKMTLDQKRKAPILEIPTRTIQLGTLKPGVKKVGKFKVNNKGQNALEIRRIINNNKELAIHPAKLTVSGGRTAEITAELNTKDLPDGDYRKSITIQTNDPENSFLILVMAWNIKK